MKILFPFLLIFFACSTKQDKKVEEVIAEKSVSKMEKNSDISNPNNTLSGKIETFELEYIVWGCSCPNWITKSDREKFENDNMINHCIFIESENDSLDIPVYFDPFRHRIIVKGQFYDYPDYPKGTLETEEVLKKSKVFRYSKIEVVLIPKVYSKKDEQTLILDYNAIACTCAQWSESKYNGNNDKEYFYLERANSELIEARELFNGTDLPLQIEVTGQIVSLNGYPTGYNPTKGNPKAGKVFRYTKLKVLK